MRTSDHLLITEKGMGGWVMVFNATFNNTSVFVDEGRKTQICRKSLANFIT
jgi:hypothetical protein